ncbi:hypothetical protein GCM10011404_04400 [Sphingomonas prati]|nr:hypothetical protein GCM10011404_04400 [Sphingomonas prati]
MQLSSYLAREGYTYLAFAKRIGSDHARTVERYAKGQSVPNRTMMRRISEVTNAEVTANDFFAQSPMARPFDGSPSPTQGQRKADTEAS